MRGLTVRQPWAWAIIHGGKDVENRTRSLGQYRGPVAIHAGRQWAGDEALAEVERMIGFDSTPGGFILGNVIGVVNLVDAHPDVDQPEGCRTSWLPWRAEDICSEWAQPGQHHLMFSNPRPLAHPIPWRGRLGLWTVPADLEAAIREQVAP